MGLRHGEGDHERGRSCKGMGGGLGGCGLGVARGVGYWEWGADGADLITSLSKMGRSHWSVEE